MAEIDASIPLGVKPIQIEDPGTMQAKALQLRQLALQTQGAQQDYQDQQTLRQLYQQNAGDPAALTSSLYKAGLGKQAIALQQQQLGNQKTVADIGESNAKASNQNAEATKTQLETTLKNVQNVGSRIYALAQTPNISHDQAFQEINSWVNQGIVKPDQGAQIARALPGDPQQLKQYLMQKAVEGQGIEQQIQMHLQNMPKPQYEDVGGQKVGVDMNPLTNGGTLPTLKKTATPGEVLTAATADKRIQATAEKGFSPDEGEMLGALAQHGVSLPSGLRSKDQMKATVRNLIDRNPGKTPDEIAEMVGNGQINFGSDKASATVAAKQEGKVSTAVNELSAFGDQALAASAAVPRGQFVPVNKLLQMADSSISDPSLLTLKLKLNALNNAYNVLSARGGTDAASRAHIQQLFSSANGPEGVQALVKALKEEGAGARASAATAAHVGAQSTSAGSGHPADIQDILNKYAPSGN